MSTTSSYDTGCLEDVRGRHVGADGDDTGARDTGAAYLFTTSGTLVTAFTNPTPATADFFDYSLVAVGNDKVLIGAAHSRAAT